MLRNIMDVFDDKKICVVTDSRMEDFMKKYFYVLLVAILSVVCLTACGSDDKEENKTKKTTQQTESNSAKETPDTEKGDNQELLSGKYAIEIDIKDYGVIKAEVDADIAPITVTNFIKLVKEGFYDGLTFHRIIDGFMIQGGDPLGNGTGGSGETIKGEFAYNGVENNLSHKRGVLSMARASMDYDSASSQFFIMHQDSEALDGQYAAFGEVTEGIEIVDKICENTPVLDENGTVDAKEQPVITSIKVVE